MRIALLALCFLIGCNAPPQQAPPSASERVEPTAHGLLGLFERECIEQRNLPFVHETANRRRERSCMASDGNCQQDMDLLGVTWTVRTTTAAELSVQMGWPVGVTPDQPLGPPPGPLACGISVPAELAPALQETAQLYASANPGSQELRLTETEDTWALWREAPAPN